MLTVRSYPLRKMAAMVFDLILKAFVVAVISLGSTHAQATDSACAPLLAPANGMSSCSSNGVTLYCKATCITGYAFPSGDASITKSCSGVSGTWQGGNTFSDCQKINTGVCSPLKTPTNGILSCSGSGNVQLCTATCNTGYRFVTGDKFISKTCSNVTGGWTGGNSLPECTAKTCTAPLLASVNDSHITASSVWKGVHVYYFGPERARMSSNITTSGSIVLAGGWRPATNTLDQYIQVELNSVSRITGIATAGRLVLSGDTANEYVTRYRVLYSLDGLTWEPYSSETVIDQFLDGNKDNVLPNVNSLSCPFDAKYVRINPLAWHDNIAMRFELYGCEADGTKPVCKSSIPVPSTPLIPVPTTTTLPTTTIAVPTQNLCHPIPTPINGVVNCEQRGNQVICVASCAKGYIFETKEALVKRVCMTNTGVWPATQSLPACIRNTQTLQPTQTFPNGCLTTEANCEKINNGDYQACGGCHYFSTCSEGFLYIRACPERLLFDASSKVCDYHSSTCPSI